MLEVHDLRVHYGTVEAVKGVSFHLDAGEMISLEHYGASAAYETLYQEFGLTPQRVSQAARRSISLASQAAEKE